MFCKNCGNEISENQKFCPKCGTLNVPFQGASTQSVPVPNAPTQNLPSQQTANLNQQGVEPVQRVAASVLKKKNNKMIIGIIIGAIIVIAAVATAIIFAGKSQDNKPETSQDIGSRSSKTTESTTESPKYNLVNSEKLTVAISASLKPIIYEENGIINGFDSELISLIAEKLGVDVDFVEWKNEKIITAVSEGKVDIAIGAIDNKNEKKGALFSEVYTSVESIEEDGIKVYNYIIAINPQSKLYDDINEQILEFKNNGTIENLKEKYKINKLVDLYGILPEYTDTNDKKIMVQGIKEIKFKANETKQNLILTNNKDNICFLKYTAYIDVNQNGEQDDNDKLIFETDLVPPGYSVSEVSLNRKMSEGSYETVIIVDTYSYDREMRPLNKLKMQSTITVE